MKLTGTSETAFPAKGKQFKIIALELTIIITYICMFFFYMYRYMYLNSIHFE